MPGVHAPGHFRLSHSVCLSGVIYHNRTSRARLLERLGIVGPEFPFGGLSSRAVNAPDAFGRALLPAMICKSHFERDLPADVDLHRPALYSQIAVEHFIKEMGRARGFSAEFFSEPEYLFLPRHSRALEASFTTGGVRAPPKRTCSERWPSHRLKR